MVNGKDNGTIPLHTNCTNRTQRKRKANRSVYMLLSTSLDGYSNRHSISPLRESLDQHLYTFYIYTKTI